MLFLLGSVSSADVDANDAGIISAGDDEIVNLLNEDNQVVEHSQDEIADAKNDLNVLSTNNGNYSGLAGEIANKEYVELNHDYYSYDSGFTIDISTANAVINGNGAIIDMAWSEIQALKISASGVTIKNLTIKNANYKGDGGAIYFSTLGNVEHCNFINNTASHKGGAILFNDTGNVANCNFINNTVNWYGGAIWFSSYANVINCNFTNNQFISISYEN